MEFFQTFPLKKNWKKPWKGLLTVSEPTNIYVLYEPPPPPQPLEPQGDRISPFPAKCRNGSAQISMFQRLKSCALPKTEPVGDDLQSTAPWPINDDDDDDLRNHKCLIA